MEKYIAQAVTIWVSIFLVWFLFFYNDSGLSSKDKEYQAKIDSLQNKITLNQTQIDSLTLAQLNLDSLYSVNKGKLNEISKKAEIYKQKYNEERNRINAMSNDDIVREFTTTFE